MTVRVVDIDQHLYETRTLWGDFIDPAHRADALSLTDDDLGYAWLTWRGQRLDVADVHLPGDTASVGRHRQHRRRDEPPEYVYDEALPAPYWEPAARVAWLDEVGLDESVCFPNFGLLWERRLSHDLPALTANMRAWNRWAGEVVTAGGGRLHPVAHLTLRDESWLREELARLASSGVKLAMIAPADVDGRPLSAPEHDSLWAAFVEHDIAPVFHVADQPRVFDDCWYTSDEESLVPVIESAFLWVPPALALTDMILNGVFDRHPRLRVGVVELSSIWVPQFLLMLDGAHDFTSKLNGKPLAELSHRPSEYFARHVRVSSFSYELPARLTAKSGDVFMACSDYPHSEGTATPIADYERSGVSVGDAPAFFSSNADFLLGRN